ncbi:cationic amino acid transporter 2, vacuolar-like isoform X1 [Typha latifolia]|uniref:cationic amino acid transporter 2, vacuolar-like isoform X1 n=1 Tax=Typha latifolia TaxID=4733 RepID=UPI003C2FA630
MGLEEGTSSQERGGGGGRGWGMRCLVRRKQVDSDRVKVGERHQQLNKILSIPQLIAIGVGSTIGAGVYVLVGTVAREHAGPALTISFLIAGIAAALSAFCYAELASRCPSAGSAYHYSYICVGEGVAWLIGWALILEYTVGGSAVARGISPNLALFFGGQDSLPFFLARAHIPGLDIVVDPCAAILALTVTGLLCMGIKESSSVQAVVTAANVCVMLFVIIAGGYIGFHTGWVGYSVASGYFPYGVNGMLAGSATVFFAYIGFDSVASTAEEVKNPQRDLPWGIGTALSICCFLYMMVSIVIVGIVPYFAIDPDTPISSAFARHGMHWAMYIVTTGAVLALCSTLMGSILPQPRILMSMARDGLLPPFFSDVNKQTQVPVKSTILTGICAASLAFFMDVSQLAGMVSVGTLLAFTIVAISILILRYVPPDEVPLPSSLQESIDSISLHYDSQEIKTKDIAGVETDSQKPQGGISRAKGVEVSAEYPLIMKESNQVSCSGSNFLMHVADKLDEQVRRKRAALSIASVCIGVVILTFSASATFLAIYISYLACSVGGLLLLAGLGVLSWIDQDNGRHSFGYSGGFICPFIPFLPIMSILINTYLLVNLGTGTWIRVSVWLVIGVFVYIFYGRTHSSLTDVVYVPLAHADKIQRTSSDFVA